MSYELDAEGTQRLNEYLSRIARVLRHKKKTEAFAYYTIGLMSNLERKSVEPIAAYIEPDPQKTDAMHQKLLHFQGEAVWDDREVRLSAARYGIDAMEKHEPVIAWILDDTGFLKQGKHSVGVKRQYTGSAGKITNCQVGVSLSVSTPTAHVPIDFELYLPEEWAKDPELRRMAKIPDDVMFMTKPELALEMITRASHAGIPGKVILADCAYGDSVEFRDTVRLIGFDYGLGVSCTTKVVRVDDQGRPHGDAVSAQDFADGLPESAFERITWREGTSKALGARFVFQRVRVCREGPDAEVQWLVIEWRDGEKGPEHFTLTTLGMNGEMSKQEIVSLFKERYRTEQAYEELKGELGLDHFEGRSFRGWHHHVTVVLCCYAFVVAERALHRLPSLCRQAVWEDHTQSLRLAA